LESADNASAGLQALVEAHKLAATSRKQKRKAAMAAIAALLFVVVVLCREWHGSSSGDGSGGSPRFHWMFFSPSAENGIGQRDIPATSDEGLGDTVRTMKYHNTQP